MYYKKNLYLVQPNEKIEVAEFVCTRHLGKGSNVKQTFQGTYTQIMDCSVHPLTQSHLVKMTRCSIGWHRSSGVRRATSWNQPSEQGLIYTLNLPNSRAACIRTWFWCVRVFDVLFCARMRSIYRKESQWSIWFTRRMSRQSACGMRSRVCYMCLCGWYNKHIYIDYVYVCLCCVVDILNIML